MHTVSLTLRTALVAIVAMAAQSALVALPIEYRTATTGTRVHFVPSPSVPMLDISLGVDTGSHYEPVAKVSLVSLTAGMLDKGITAQGNVSARDEAAITDVFADVGTGFDGGAGGNRASLRPCTLSDPVERGPTVALIMWIISASTFPGAILACDKQRLVAMIRESLTRPSVLAKRAFGKVVYGTHPYRQAAASKTVGSITRNDTVRHYQANYTTRHAIVTLIDAISRQEAKAITEQVTRNLSVDGAMPPALPDVKMSLVKTETIRIPHPAQQATIILGQPGIARGGKDHSPLLVGNYVLDRDGFNARLTNEVRKKRGLTYSIGSHFTPTTRPGPFELVLQARKDQTGEALGVVRDTAIKSVADGSIDVELEVARDNLVNDFPLRLDSNRKLLDNVVNISWYDLPLDYLDTWT